MDTLIDKCLEIHYLTSRVYASTNYKKKFECKNCSEWFHDNKHRFDKKPVLQGPIFMKCDSCGYYNIVHRSSKSKSSLDIYRKYTKFEISCLCVQMKWTIPIHFFSEEPDSDDSGLG